MKCERGLWSCKSQVDFWSDRRVPNNCSLTLGLLISWDRFAYILRARNGLDHGNGLASKRAAPNWVGYGWGGHFQSFKYSSIRNATFWNVVRKCRSRSHWFHNMNLMPKHWSATDRLYFLRCPYAFRHKYFLSDHWLKNTYIDRFLATRFKNRI